MSKRRLLIVERDEAETYVLLSLVAFGPTVVLVRLVLELSGYPQVGSSTLHIAHLLWGGLFLFVAVLMVLWTKVLPTQVRGTGADRVRAGGGPSQ